ncbi:MAG TPA: Crp/Fnr family transcriptional regulator [Verrucomicrobiae bacterium]
MILPVTKARLANQFTEAPTRLGTSAPQPADAQLELLYNRIARQPFFKGLEARHLHLLAASALEMQFETGQTIFQEGSPANSFYLILAGKVVLEAETADRNLIPIQTLGPGDDLGWAWLFPPYSVRLSARALEPTRTIFFFGTRLREQCEQDHELGYQLMQRIAQVATQCLRATQQRLVELTETGNRQK